MKKLIMDEITYIVNDDVAELIVMISKERDDLKAALTSKTDDVATSPLQRGVIKLLPYGEKNDNKL